MSTSGSTNWTVNRNEIVTRALRLLRVIDANESAPANDITTGAEALNAMIKAWALDDIQMWLNQEAVVFLAEDGQSYDLGGTSGDPFCALSDMGKTQLSAAVAASGTALTVDSITGAAASDYIGIELDDGTLHWDTINGAPSGSTINITTGVASAASADNWVFHFTSYLARPTEIIEARIRDTDDNDEPIDIIRSTTEFMSITDKTSAGDCQIVHIVPTISQSTLYTWPVADDVSKRLILTIRRPIEDFDSSSDNADMPIEVLNPLTYNLALEIAPEYGAHVPQLVLAQAKSGYDLVKRKFRESNPIYIRPSK